uniref:Proteasome subunit beta n=1 Tax=Gopherus evgoodei TaxID=1825980 RepID=A0A8C4VL33_9SAUR
MLSTAGYAEPRPGMGHQLGAPVQHRFSPYTFNGGTVLAIAGEDFSIVASDTRLSEGYAIHSRDSPKCYKLTDQTVIGCSGFHGDCLTLTKIIEARLKMYKHSNNKAMTTGAIAAMLSTILYSRCQLLLMAVLPKMVKDTFLLIATENEKCITFILSVK